MTRLERIFMEKKKKKIRKGNEICIGRKKKKLGVIPVNFYPHCYSNTILYVDSTVRCSRVSLFASGPIALKIRHGQNFIRVQITDKNDELLFISIGGEY